MNRKLRATLMATALLIGGGVLTAPAAHAENHGTMPKGCSISPITPKLDAKKRVAYSGSGYCKAIPINNFVAILVHNYDGLPDARRDDPVLHGSGILAQPALHRRHPDKQPEDAHPLLRKQGRCCVAGLTPTQHRPCLASWAHPAQPRQELPEPTLPKPIRKRSPTSRVE